MENGNARATMVELDMVYVSYFGNFLSKQNILFGLSPPRKAARPPRKSRQATKKSRQAGRKAGRPGQAFI
jgi:hypothetical protein